MASLAPPLDCAFEPWISLNVERWTPYGIENTTKLWRCLNRGFRHALVSCLFFWLPTRTPLKLVEVIKACWYQLILRHQSSGRCTAFNTLRRTYIMSGCLSWELQAPHENLVSTHLLKSHVPTSYFTRCSVCSPFQTSFRWCCSHSG